MTDADARDNTAERELKSRITKMTSILSGQVKGVQDRMDDRMDKMQTKLENFINRFDGVEMLTPRTP